MSMRFLKKLTDIGTQLDSVHTKLVEHKSEAEGCGNEFSTELLGKCRCVFCLFVCVFIDLLFVVVHSCCRRVCVAVGIGVGTFLVSSTVVDALGIYVSMCSCVCFYVWR